jgi:hypothetical protein
LCAGKWNGRIGVSGSTRQRWRDHGLGVIGGGFKRGFWLGRWQGGVSTQARTERQHHEHYSTCRRRETNHLSGIHRGAWHGWYLIATLNSCAVINLARIWHIIDRKALTAVVVMTGFVRFRFGLALGHHLASVRSTTVDAVPVLGSRP